MTITVDGPDGSSFEFPDGTPAATITGAMAKHYGGAPAPAPSAAPQAPAPTYSTADQIVGAAARGVPILGAGDTWMDSMIDALAHPVTGSGEPGATVMERHAKNLAKKQAAAEAFAREHPVLDTAAGLGGGALALGGVAGAVPKAAEALGVVGKTLPAMRNAALSGTAIGTLDAAARGEDPTAGGIEGALTGAGGVLAGKAIGKGYDAVRRLVSRETPPVQTRFMDVNGTQVPVPESVVTQDPAAASFEERARKGSEGDRAREIATAGDEATRQGMAQANQALLDQMRPGAEPATPQSAAHAAVDDLVANEQQRAAGEAQRLQGAENARAGIQTGMDPTQLPQRPGEPPSNPFFSGQEVQEGLQRRATGLARMRDAAYDAVARIPGEFLPGVFRQASNAIRDRLNSGSVADRVRINPENTPLGQQALNLIDEELGQQRFTNNAARGENVIGPDGRPQPRPITAADVEEVRKALVQLRRQANNAARAPGGSGQDARAVGRVMDAFDDLVGRGVNAGGFTGDGEAYLGAINRARALHSEFRGTYSKQNGADKVGGTIEDIIGRNGAAPMNPGKIVSSLVGSPDNPGSGMAHGVAVLQRLRDVLGPQSREWASLRKAVLDHLTQPVPGMEAIPHEQQADRVLKFLNSPASRLHAEVLYNPAEQTNLRQLAGRLRGARDAAPANDAQKTIAKWSGRTGEAPASAQTVVAELMNGESKRSAALAAELRNHLSPDSLAQVKQGVWRNITEGAEGGTQPQSQKIANSIAKFLRTDLAEELFTPNERLMMREIGNAHSRLIPMAGTVNTSNTAHVQTKIAKGLSSQLLTLFGFAHGGMPGAAAALAAGKSLNWLADRRGAKEAVRIFRGEQPVHAMAPTVAPQKALAVAAPVLLSDQRSR